MAPRWILMIAAASGWIGVAVGAFGAHGLPKQLEKQGFEENVIQKKLQQCETGVRYNLVHAVVMLAIGLSGAARNSGWLRAACGMFLCGTFCFSGGLYSISMLDRMGHWSIVPLGGVLFLIGWLLVAIAAWRASDADNAIEK